MNTVIALPEFRYLISMNTKNLLTHQENSDEKLIGSLVDESMPAIKKTNILATALEIASNDPRASEIFDNVQGQVIFQKRKIF